MYVIKRNGIREDMNFDKVRRRIATLQQMAPPLERVDVIRVAKKVVDGLYSGVKTSELDELAAETAAQLVTVHPEYGTLAARVFVSSLHKEVPARFSDFVAKTTGWNPSFLAAVKQHRTVLDATVVRERDYDLSYFGLRTLEKSYLAKRDGKTVETPQYMWLRVALAIHGSDIERAVETYNLMSTKHFTHATPTLCNAGRIRQTLSSCFLTQIHDDSIDGIFDTVKDCALISKASGGIGVSVSNVRAAGAVIGGSGGTANGLVPMARVFNNVARYVDQGGNKRPGAFAMYLEPWHADVFEFLELRKNHGKDELRARDIFTALWVPDLFMRRVKENNDWSLFCPSVAPGLDECWGEEFETLYTLYEATRPRRKVPAQQLWRAIIDAQIETGTPYMLYKDACNRASNHNHMGTIKGSNLCVAPETNILTKNGYLRIDTLKDKSVEVWNGHEWSMVTVRQTSDKSRLLRVTLTNNLVLECTPNHKFYLKNGVEVAAADLLPGDKLLKWCPPNDHCESPYTHESLRDTTRCKTSTILSVEDTGRDDATYCFTEPKRHMGVFNGILTGQCSEIVEYFSKDETAVCNLASIGLPTFVADGAVDYPLLCRVAGILVRNLDNIIKINTYPTDSAKRSNRRHRPIGIGVQGLADVFVKLQLPFDSAEARAINKKIFETIYYGALSASADLAAERGQYVSYPGSRVSQGLLHCDSYATGPQMWDWAALRAKIAAVGLRNSLLVAPMPTASTSQILGFNECFEPYTSNMYNRRVRSGEFQMVNAPLVAALSDAGLWTDEIKNSILQNNGSVQHVAGLDPQTKAVFRTVWEIPQKSLIDMAADRAPYIDQSQSLNIFLEEPSYSKISSMHFYGWDKGLKTGMYYLRTRPAARSTQFTVEPAKQADTCQIGCDSCSA